MAEEKYEFSVDTHLFRELGELLVGRESTALVELIKNSYDADATQVVVRGEGLLTGRGTLSIEDDGIGMTPEIFRTAFLRIAGRYKEKGNRLSPRYMRRYTGAKGVGRLSAHKLADCLEIRSVPDAEILSTASDDSDIGVDAVINWRSMEEDHQTLNDIGDGLKVAPFPVMHTDKKGTQLQLKGMRTRWTVKNLPTFVRQVASCVPPPELVAAPSFPLSKDHQILGSLRPWTRSVADPGFEIKLKGDLDIGESLWPLLIERSHWLLEIRADPDGVLFAINPTPTMLKSNPEAQNYLLRREHPDPINGPFFTARIYTREGSFAQRGTKLSNFVEDQTGIRVYLEGFQVVPYGERKDDWLEINQDYSRRVRELRILLDDRSSTLLPEIPNESFSMVSTQQYIGGVFLTAAGASALRPVVNREGFLQDEIFENLRTMVRNGVDLVTRARVSAKTKKDSADYRSVANRIAGPSIQDPSFTKPTEKNESINEQPFTTERTRTKAETPEPSTDETLSFSLTRAREELLTIRAMVSSNPPLAQQVDLAKAAVDLAEQSVEQSQAERAMLEVLASVGLQFAAFIHEVNGLLGQAQAARQLAEALTLEDPPSPSQRSIVRSLRAGLDTLCQSLARQASYLTEVIGPDARRRRRRIPLGEAPRTSLELLSSTFADRDIEIIQDLDNSVRTPPIFPAELTIICTNLLTNAAKAVGTAGQVMISGGASQDGGVWLRVENTGVQVDLETAERWFRPFESTTTEVDVVLGQGMGLGLPITRRIMSEYSGSVRFVEPSSGFSTAVEVRLPPRRST